MPGEIFEGFEPSREKQNNKLELSSAKLRRLMKLTWNKFDEMIFDSLEAILKDSLGGFNKYLKL